MMSDSEEESENEEKEDEAASAARDESPPPPQVSAKSSRPFVAIPAPSSLVVTHSKPWRTMYSKTRLSSICVGPISNL